MTRADDYRKLRAEHPDLAALTLWRWATSPKPHSLEWDEDGSETVGTATIDGWDVRATITDDYEVDASETYGTLTDRYERGAFENPYWREWHGADGHFDGCRHPDDAARWYVDASGETFDELRVFYRKYLTRHESYSRALADLRERAETCRSQFQDWSGRYSFALVDVTVSLAGVEVSSAGFGGYSWERDYSKPLDPQLDAIVDDAVREALADAPDGVSEAIARERASATDRLDRAASLVVAAERMVIA